MLVIESFAFFNLSTPELRKTIDFYTALLDFDVLQESPDRAVLSFENIKIKLYQSSPLDNETDNPEEQKQVADNSVPVMSFLMDVDDFTDALQVIENQQIEFVAGPDTIQNGESFLIRDPGHNLIEFFYQE